MIELTEEEITDGLNEAFLKAGHNAYFGNGFNAGVEFALEKVKKLNIHDVIMQSEQLGCECKNQKETIFGYTWKTCVKCGETSLMPN